MFLGKKTLSILLTIFITITAFTYLIYKNRVPRSKATGSNRFNARIINQKLYVNNQRVALKTAWLLANWAAEDTRSWISVLKNRGYNAIKLSIYWIHFDSNGDGIIDNDPDLVNINRFIAEARRQGMYIGVDFETGNVGGIGIPPAFFEKYPDAQAVNSRGELVRDTYWHGPNSPIKVQSIINDNYLRVSRNFIQNVLRKMNTSEVLWYETAVEPHYYGTQHFLDYSEAARQSYLREGGNWPPSDSDNSNTDSNWNRFRARHLAQWIDGDARAMREIVGNDALIAVDYLEVGNDVSGHDMRYVNGNAVEFLNALQTPNIIQVNWHWGYCRHPFTGPCDTGYNTVREIARQKNWALSEHMTINGDFDEACQSDRTNYTRQLLENTIAKGNTIGWEIVTVRPDSNERFSVYNSDWSPKCAVAAIDTPEATEEWFRLLLGPDYRLPTTPTYTPIPTNTPRPSPTPTVGPTNTPIRFPSPTPTAGPTNTPIVFPSIGTTIIPSPTPAGCPRKSEGNADCDGSVNLTDYEIWRGEYLGEDTANRADFDDDGRVTLTDFEVWRGTYLQ